LTRRLASLRSAIYEIQANKKLVTFHARVNATFSFSMNRLLHPRTLSRIQKQKVSSGGSYGGGGGVKLILGVAAGAVGGNWVYKNYIKGPESSGLSKIIRRLFSIFLEKNFSKYMPKVPELPRKKGTQVQQLS